MSIPFFLVWGLAVLIQIGFPILLGIWFAKRYGVRASFLYGAAIFFSYLHPRARRAAFVQAIPAAVACRPADRRRRFANPKMLLLALTAGRSSRGMTLGRYRFLSQSADLQLEGAAALRHQPGGFGPSCS